SRLVGESTRARSGGATAPDPQHALKRHAGGSGGFRIEAVSSIDQAAGLVASGGGGKRGVQQRGAAGRGRAKDLSERAAGPAAGEFIERSQATRSQLGRGTVVGGKCAGNAVGERGREFLTQGSSRTGLEQ